MLKISDTWYAAQCRLAMTYIKDQYNDLICKVPEPIADKDKVQPTIGEIERVKDHVCYMKVYHSDNTQYTEYDTSCYEDTKFMDILLYRKLYMWFVCREQSFTHTIYPRNGMTVYTRDMIKNIDFRIEKKK